MDQQSSTAFRSETEFTTWKSQHGTADTDIKTKLTNFGFINLLVSIEIYFTYISANGGIREASDISFLKNFDHICLIADSEILSRFKSDTHKQPSISSAVTESLDKLNTKTSVIIENLTGEEEDLLDWFENYDRIGASCGWNDEIKGIKLFFRYHNGKI